MRRLCGAIWLLLPLSSAIARSIRKAAGEQKPFSLQTDRSKPPWSNTTSRLHRRNPDAVSFHVDPNHNYAWTPIQLGVQRLGVMLDIGSTAFWVFASQNDSVQPSGLLSYTQLYVPGNSPTWQSIPNATFASGYQAGFTATGIVGTDIVTMGQVPPVSQHVGVMWYGKPVMDPQQIQGILGLGLSSDGTSGTMGTPAFLDLVMPKLESPLFTLAIDGWGTGTWDFGHINATKYTGTLRTVPNDDTCNIGGCWRVADVGARFPEGTIPQANCALLDTGFDLITLDSAIVTRYYQDIPGANSVIVPGQYTFPCNASLPDLTLTISGIDDITIPGHVLNYHPYDIAANICMGTLQSAGDGGGAVLGQAFMMAQFVVFNVGSRSISFANIAQNL